MKYLTSIVLFGLILLASCEKDELDNQLQVRNDGMIHDTIIIYNCDSTLTDSLPSDIAFVNAYRSSKQEISQNTRCKFGYKIPDIASTANYRNGLPIYNCAVKFYEECDFATEDVVLQFKNVGDGAKGIDSPPVLGNIRYRVVAVEDIYINYFNGGSFVFYKVDAPEGQNVYVLNGNACGEYYPLVILGGDEFAVVGDYLEVTIF